jgi:aminoglycoside phosphotransferase (APT) family kinase protein
VTEADPRRDPRLPHLAAWLDLGRLVGYRPGVRAAVEIRAGDRVWYAKLTTPRRLARLQDAEDLVADTLATFAAATTADTTTGRLVAATRAAVFAGAAVYPCASGEALHTALSTVAPDRSSRLAAAGRGIASMHRLPLPEGAKTGSPYGIEDWSRWAEAHDPSCPAGIVTGALRVARQNPVVPEPARIIHGDLHDKNIFTGGETCTLIDLASVRAGRPSEDVGMLVAHVMLRALQGGRSAADGRNDAEPLLDAYWSAGGPARPGAVEAETARTLARLACLYRLRRRWHPITLDLLAAAVRVPA